MGNQRGRGAAVAIFVVAACSGPDNPTVAPEEPDPRPNYHEDVYPIFLQNCFGCHTQRAAAKVALNTQLDTFEGAHYIAGKIPHKILNREMPPWGVDHDGTCGSWLGARWLSQADTATLLKWVEIGAPRGKPSKTQYRDPLPQASLRNPTAAHSIGDGYRTQLGAGALRCFVVDPKVASDVFLTGFELEPRTLLGVEQLTLYALDTPEAEAKGAELEQSDPEPGYECYGGSRIPGARFLAGTTFASPVMRLPEGTGLRLLAGRKLVALVHYNLIAGVGLDGSLQLKLDLAPSALEATWLSITAPDLVLEPAQTETTVEAASFVQQPRTLHGVYPRMRLLGKRLNIFSEAAGSRTCLADQFEWNYHTLQELRTYAAPRRIEAGSRITVRCSHVTLSSELPVRGGDAADEEECTALLYTTTP